MHAQVSPCYPADLCVTVETAPPPPSLARTGAGESVNLAYVALALIVVGLVLVVAVRRRLALA